MKIHKYSLLVYLCILTNNLLAGGEQLELRSIDDLPAVRSTYHIPDQELLLQSHEPGSDGWCRQLSALREFFTRPYGTEEAIDGDEEIYLADQASGLGLRYEYSVMGLLSAYRGNTDFDSLVKSKYSLWQLKFLHNLEDGLPHIRQVIPLLMQ